MVFWYLYVKYALARWLLPDSSGQAMLEYAVILGLVVVAVIGSATLLGSDVAGLYDHVNQGMYSTFEGKNWFNG